MIHVHYDSLHKTEIFISGLVPRFQDYRPFWQQYLAPYVYSEITSIFTTQGRGTWAPLSPAYAARKAITHPGKSILRRDDEYFSAATTGDHSGSIAKFSAKEMVLGVSGGHFESSFGVNYPALHESGGGPLPARPVYELIVAGSQFEDSVRHLGNRYMSERLLKN